MILFFNAKPEPRRALLIVGGGILQTYAIRIARGLGHTVCVLDGDPRAPGALLADDFLPTSTRDIPAAIRTAREFHRRHRLCGVMTCGTDVSVTVASIAQALKLPGIRPEAALKASHKGLMRKTLKRHGLPVPDFHVVCDFKAAKAIVQRSKTPLVIKPADNMGARGVRKITGLAGLEAAFAEALRQSRTDEVILETFLPAREISMDTLMVQGRMHCLTIADRIVSGTPYFIERGHTLPSTLPDKTLRACLAMAERGARALGIRWGPVKFDMRATPRGPVIGEMAARLSGGFHSQCTDPLSTGMNSIKAVINQCMGDPVDMRDITPRFRMAAAERSLYPRPGYVTAIRGLDKVRAMPGIHQVLLSVQVGDLLRPVTSNMGKAGHVIGFGRNRREAVRVTREAVRTLQIITRPEPEGTRS